jgi:hypothetical protein
MPRLKCDHHAQSTRQHHIDLRILCGSAYGRSGFCQLMSNLFSILGGFGDCRLWISFDHDIDFGVLFQFHLIALFIF